MISIVFSQGGAGLWAIMPTSNLIFHDGTIYVPPAPCIFDNNFAHTLLKTNDAPARYFTIEDMRDGICAVDFFIP